MVGQAKAQRGLNLKDDTLTQSVLIHPPIKTTEKAYSLATRSTLTAPNSDWATSWSETSWYKKSETMRFQGQTVEPGQIVAKVGNNANSRNPHVHVGAWKGNASLLGSTTGTPLQIQLDLYAEGRSSTGEADE